MENFFDFKNKNIEALVCNKDAFNRLVHTDINEAISEITQRRKDKFLQRVVDEYFHGDIPEPLKNNFKAIIFRQLITPNYEIRYFLNLIKNNNIEPMFLEYLDDKFTSINPLKHSLGKMKFQIDSDKHRRARVESENIIEFNTSNGRKINELNTVWGQPLVEFHHALLESEFPESINQLYDGSLWFHRLGENAKKYYERYTALFIRNGILFENFHLEGEELRFIKSVFLPAFFNVWEKTGKKPLIAPVLPLDNHNEIFWTSYPLEKLDSIRRSKKNKKVV